MILLVHPSNKLVKSRDSKYSKISLTPSLGLAYIASYLRSKQIGVKILDLRLYQNPEAVLIEALKESPEYVGVSAYTESIHSAMMVVKLTKRYDNKIKTIVGGAHPTARSKEVSAYPFVDYVIKGEGEYETYNIIRDKKPRGIYQSGLVDIEGLDYPAWDLFELNKYSPIMPISSSRGCPASCYFCSRNYLGKTRLRSADSVIGEIEWLFQNFGSRYIQFSEATFGLNQKDTYTLCNKLLTSEVPISWNCYTRADKVNKELLDLYKRCGCKVISFGIESGNERLLKDVIHKNETKQEMLEAVHYSNKIGLTTRCYFIIGHAFETKETIKDTIEFAKELHPTQLSFGLMCPYPGSEIRELAEKNIGGLRILHSDWKRYTQVGYDCMELEQIPLNEFKSYQSKAYLEYFMKHKMSFFSMFKDVYSIKDLPKLSIYALRNLVHG